MQSASSVVIAYRIKYCLRLTCLLNCLAGKNQWYFERRQQTNRRHTILPPPVRRKLVTRWYARHIDVKILPSRTSRMIYVLRILSSLPSSSECVLPLLYLTNQVKIQNPSRFHPCYLLSCILTSFRADPCWFSSDHTIKKRQNVVGHLNLGSKSLDISGSLGDSKTTNSTYRNFRQSSRQDRRKPQKKTCSKFVPSFVYSRMTDGTKTKLRCKVC